MPAKRGLLKGKKFNGKHTTMIDAAVGIVRFLRNREEVTKIVIGPITAIRPGIRRLKISSVPAGLKLGIRGSNSQQVLFAYTSKPDSTSGDLKKFWQNQIS